MATRQLGMNRCSCKRRCRTRPFPRPQLAGAADRQYTNFAEGSGETFRKPSTTWQFKPERTP